MSNNSEPQKLDFTVTIFIARLQAVAYLIQLIYGGFDIFSYKYRSRK